MYCITGCEGVETLLGPTNFFVHHFFFLRQPAAVDTIVAIAARCRSWPNAPIILSSSHFTVVHNAGSKFNACGLSLIIAPRA